ncbi:unnamed protein product, partial [marine sediment metagenome]
MKYLMHFCTNWKGQGCNPEVEEQGYAKEIKNGEEIPLMPVGEEQDKLDEICKNCDSRSIITEEQKCPICDSVNIEARDISEGLSKKDMT